MMRKTIITYGTICAFLLSACGQKAPVQTTKAENSYQSFPGKIQVEGLEPQVITVNTREKVTVVPDIAAIVYGVTTQHEDANQCRQENQEKVAALIETLKQLEIAEKSIQTSGYNMYPRQDWESMGDIVGYEMTTQVTVSDIPLDQVGQILAASTAAGANQIESLSYLSSSYDQSYEQALKKAVQHSQDKAQALADASGSTLGQAVKITEHSANQSARYETNAAAKAEMLSAAPGASVMPGEIEIEANITVEYAIQ